jgi:lipid-A-disaccharide synthase-like uncharacterized protein
MPTLMTILGTDNMRDTLWVLVGLFGQLMFTMRFIVQWLASERAGRSVVPIAFWYFSLAGGLIVLAYGLHKWEPVIIVGQLPGTLIYARNLWLIQRARSRAAV